MYAGKIERVTSTGDKVGTRKARNTPLVRERAQTRWNFCRRLVCFMASGPTATRQEEEDEEEVEEVEEITRPDSSFWSIWALWPFKEFSLKHNW